MISFIIVIVASYLIGSISFSVLFTKKFAGFDVRKRGSGNAGSTNVLRTAGKKVAIITLICDILKGVIAVFFAIMIGNMFNVDDHTKATLAEFAGIFVVIGHTFPIFFEFKGGKGVATALGVLLVFNWKIGLICLIFALIIMAITKIVSLGSVSAAILFPILCIFIQQNYIVEGDHFSYIIFGLIMALIVSFNHRENIKRIMEGKENKLKL
ncbi:MAG: glycerol-3-phosphate 1-O-acyltransferase PlsY [Clostridia bacterium]|nr:glycerol-3-phosphate 1-O-acyltransferase PlsY [Clostridia bacterium]